MKNSYYLRLVLLMLLSLSSFNSMANEPQALHLRLTDGTTNVFKFDDSPEVTFSGDMITVTSATGSYTVEIDNVAEFFFADIPSKIDDASVAKRNVIHVGDATVFVHDAKIADISIFDISGRKLSPNVHQQSDGVSISIRTLPVGIYIIRINNQSVKFTKR